MISPELEVSLNLAVSEAARRGHEYVTVEHILYALLNNDTAIRALRACGGSIDSIRKSIEDFFGQNHPEDQLQAGQMPQPTLAFQRVIQRAAQHVRASGKEAIKGENLLVSIFSERESFAVYFLKKQEISRFDVINFISHGVAKPGFEEFQSDDTSGEGQSDGGEDDDAADQNMNQGVGASRKKRQPLKQYAIDLCQKARSGKIDPLIGRSYEIERTVQILCRRRKNNPLYVGEAGVGKTAIAEGLALRIVAGDVPAPLQCSEIYALDMGALVAGSRFRGDFEQRLKDLVKALQAKENAILFIDEIHTVIGAGSVSGGALDASNLLKPALSSGELRCIGSTTYKEYRQHFANDHALARRFQKIDVDEPSIEDTVKILQGLKSRYEDHHQVTYTAKSLRMAAELAAQHLRDRRLPDTAIDVIDEAGASFTVRAASKKKIGKLLSDTIEDSDAGIVAKGADTTASEGNEETEPDAKANSNVVHLKTAEQQVDSKSQSDSQKDQQQAKGSGSGGLGKEDEERKVKRPRVLPSDIQSIVAKMARIPAQKVTATDKKSLASLEAELKGVVFGQDPAIDSLVAVIKLSRSGLRDEEKPIGSFLFAGPTGVGKTEVAKQLANALGTKFLRYDMSEYMERHAVSRLIGAPPGYVGYDQGGLLTEAVNKTPHAVVLLDEIEKAHPDIQNVLLQVMDHGTLTDGNGRETDFRNVVIILTTNAGAREMSHGAIGFSRSALDDMANSQAIKDSFSPEFRNRLDSIIAFAPLSEDVVLNVVDKFIKDVASKLAKQKVIIKLTESARRWLAKEGYDPSYGARPLGRLIQEKVKKPLADQLLFGELTGGGMAEIDTEDGQLSFIYKADKSRPGKSRSTKSSGSTGPKKK